MFSNNVVNAVFSEIVARNIDRGQLVRLINDKHILTTYKVFKEREYVSVHDLIEHDIPESSAYKTLRTMKDYNLITLQTLRNHSIHKPTQVWRLT